MNPILITLGVIFMTLGGLNFYSLIWQHFKEHGTVDLHDFIYSACKFSRKDGTYIMIPYGVMVLLSVLITFIGAVLLELGL